MCSLVYRMAEIVLKRQSDKVEEQGQIGYTDWPAWLLLSVIIMLLLQENLWIDDVRFFFNRYYFLLYV